MTGRPLFYPERFKDAARYYTTGRPTYPKLLARRVAGLIDLAGENVLDLGTGPGFLAIDFASLANTVTAIGSRQERPQELSVRCGPSVPPATCPAPVRAAKLRRARAARQSVWGG